MLVVNLSLLVAIFLGMPHIRNFPQPPQTFLVTMEEYVRDAPRMVPVREPLVSALVVLLNLLFLLFCIFACFFPTNRVICIS